MFKRNKFVFPLPHYSLQYVNYIRFSAFILTDKENTSVDVKGRAKLLGEAILELQPHKARLTDISEDGLRIPLVLRREENPVGRFIVNLKLVGNDILPYQAITGKPNEAKGSENNFRLNKLPLNHLDKDAKYRLRMNVYSGFSLKRENELPSYVAECCITTKSSEHLEQDVQLSSVVPESDNPIFNYQFLLNIQAADYNDKFVYLGFVDDKNKTYADRFYIPLSVVQPFTPVHVELVGSESKIKKRQSYFISFLIEEISEGIVDLVVKDLEVDPEIENNEVSSFCVALTLDGARFTAVEFKRLETDLLNPTIVPRTALEEIGHKASESPLFLSMLNKIPVIDIESHYRSIYVFTIPKALLARRMMISLLVINEKYKIEAIGFPIYASSETGEISPDTKIHEQAEDGEYDAYLLNLKLDEEPRMAYQLYKVLEERRLRLRVGIFVPYRDMLKLINIEEERQKAEVKRQMEEEALTSLQMKLVSDNLTTALTVQDDDANWKLLTSEINQKQQMINKFMAEYEEKQGVFKSTTNQINELKKQIQLFENEENRLRRRLTMEKRIETTTAVRQELEDLSEQELRAKLVRVAQAYKEERLRNVEFEKALQNAQMELVKVQKLQKEYDGLSVEHLKKNKELSEMQEEISKHQMYKETVAKQEKVIAKLEANLEKCVDYGEKYNRLIENIGAIERENVELQKEIENQMKNFEEGNSDGKLEEEVQRLELIRDQLKQELANKRPVSRQRAEGNEKRVELEIMLQSLKERAGALEAELQNNNKKYADEIVQLKDNLYYEDEY